MVGFMGLEGIFVYNDALNRQGWVAMACGVKSTFYLFFTMVTITILSL